MTQPDPPRDTVTVFKDAANEWRWRRVAGNHEIIAVSGEGYENKGDCVAMAEQFTHARAGGVEADLVIVA